MANVSIQERHTSKTAAQRLREVGFPVPLDEAASQAATSLARKAPQEFALMLEIVERTEGLMWLEEEDPKKVIDVLSGLAHRIRGKARLVKRLDRQTVFAVLDRAAEWANGRLDLVSLEFIAEYPMVNDQTLADLNKAMDLVKPTRTPASLPFDVAEDPKVFEQVAALNGLLGRRVTDSELFTVTRALKEGITPEELAKPPHPPTSVSLKDRYVWQVIQGTPEAKSSHADLLSDLAQKVKPGTSRSDDEAIESESIVHWGPSLSVLELHKVRLLWEHLQKPDTPKDIAAIVQNDLELDDTELGGMVRWKNGVIHLDEMVPDKEDRASNGHYSLPEDNPWSGITDFHLHASDRKGSPNVAGPSGLDLPGARKKHVDGVVITLIRPGVVNVDFYTASGAVVDLGDYQLPDKTT